MPSAKVKYPGLQTAVFEPGDLASLNGTYWLMRFPARWKPRLLTLAGGPGTDRVSIPIRSLNRVLTALVPDLVHVARYATRGEDPVWLLSSTPIAREAIFAITAAWVRAFGWRSPASLEQALAVMSPSDLQWEEFPVDYARQLRLTGSGEQEERGAGDIPVAAAPDRRPPDPAGPGVRPRRRRDLCLPPLPGGRRRRDHVLAAAPPS